MSEDLIRDTERKRKVLKENVKEKNDTFVSSFHFQVCVCALHLYSTDNMDNTACAHTWSHTGILPIGPWIPKVKGFTQSAHSCSQTPLRQGVTGCPQLMWIKVSKRLMLMFEFTYCKWLSVSQCLCASCGVRLCDCACECRCCYFRLFAKSTLSSPWWRSATRIMTLIFNTPDLARMRDSLKMCQRGGGETAAMKMRVGTQLGLTGFLIPHCFAVVWFGRWSAQCMLRSFLLFFFPFLLALHDATEFTAVLQHFPAHCNATRCIPPLLCEDFSSSAHILLFCVCFLRVFEHLNRISKCKRTKFMTQGLLQRRVFRRCP